MIRPTLADGDLRRCQADSLIQLIGEQLRLLRDELRARGLAPPPGSEPPRSLAQLLFPDPSALFGIAYSAFSLSSGVLGNVVVIIFVGLFKAASPGAYRRGVLSLVLRAGETASARC